MRGEERRGRGGEGGRRGEGGEGGEGRREEREGREGKDYIIFIWYLLSPQMWCGTKSGKIYIFNSRTYAEGKGVSY